jgi:intracellular septation protein A
VTRAAGQSLSTVTDDGRVLHAAVYNEHEVRAAAGLTMVAGAVAFAYAYFDKQYLPLQVVSSVFFVEFLTRLTLGLRHSPMGFLARGLTRWRPPEWVSAKPKHFAWTLGLGLAFSMTIITNSGIRGMLPRSICLLCLTLMWLESVLGLCAGCQLHAWLVRRGFRGDDPNFEVCAGGVCEVPQRASDEPAPVATVV